MLIFGCTSLISTLPDLLSKMTHRGMKMSLAVSSRATFPTCQHPMALERGEMQTQCHRAAGSCSGSAKLNLLAGNHFNELQKRNTE